MMKPFVVELTIRSVVMAEDQADAHFEAHDQFRDIARDETPDISVITEVLSASDLPYGWDMECLPWGGDGNSRLKDIVAGH